MDSGIPIYRFHEGSAKKKRCRILATKCEYLSFYYRGSLSTP
jgi:hypothetical protein